MARKVALTPASIDALKKGSLADLPTPGLAIEVLGSGKKRWRYRRLVAGTKVVATLFGGLFPARPIAARAWARGLNEKTESGIDPREALREEKARAEMTAARISEVVRAKSAETVNGVWTIPSSRVKNSFAHTIALGPWGRSLMQSNHEWVFPAPRGAGPRNNSVWYKARDRVRARMAVLAGHPVERFTR